MLVPEVIDLKTQIDNEDITYENEHSTGERTTEERLESNSENRERIKMEKQQSILNSQPSFNRNMIKEGKTPRSSYYNTLRHKGLLDKDK